MISLKYQIVCIIFKNENNNDIYGLLCTMSVPQPKKRCCDPINIFGVLVVFNLNCLFIYIYLMKKSLLLYRGNNW